MTVAEVLPGMELTRTHADPSCAGERLDRFLAANSELPTPYLVMDLELVADRYRSLCTALPGVDVFYAVKANPDRQVLTVLDSLGSSFDVASLGEVELCLELGVDPARLSFGNTVKKETDLRAAVERGVRIFAADSPCEIEKICRQVHAGTVLVRLASEGDGADWPLSRKFGCLPGEALPLLRRAADRGLELGLSFHVGSQQHDPHAWEAPLAAVAEIAEVLDGWGHRLRTVDLGGGLPSSHFVPTPPIGVYGDAIGAAVRRHLGDAGGIRLIVEPGRYLVGDAGLIRAEVVSITTKAGDGGRRWVYLDIGMFNGLVETQEEAIRYRIRCPGTAGPLAPAVLAGPTCDSLDVLYERTPYPLPTDLRVGQPIDVLSSGAYTTTYSTVWFNGIEPLRSYYLPTSEGEPR